MKIKTILLSVSIFALLISGAAYSEDLYGAKSAENEKNPTVEQMLTYAIQDEYLAHAEYEYIINEYGAIRPFSNIIRAEETHINMLKPLFDKYGYKLPENTADEHIVVPANLKAAVETGVQAEIDNIQMYENFLNRELPDDVRDIFERLKRASENHLRAFRNALSKY